MLRLRRFELLAVWLSSAWFLSQYNLSAQNNLDRYTLVPGMPVMREISGSQVHTYSVELNIGDFMHAAVQPDNVDLVVQVTDPRGTPDLTIKKLHRSRCSSRSLPHCRNVRCIQHPSPFGICA
jgi:hypothetical protein